MAIRSNPSFTQFCEAMYDPNTGNYTNTHCTFSLDALKYLYDFYTVGEKLDVTDSRDLIPNEYAGENDDTPLSKWLPLSLLHWCEVDENTFLEEMKYNFKHNDIDYVIKDLVDWGQVKITNNNYLRQVDAASL